MGIAVQLINVALLGCIVYVLIGAMKWAKRQMKK